MAGGVAEPPPHPGRAIAVAVKKRSATCGTQFFGVMAYLSAAKRFPRGQPYLLAQRDWSILHNAPVALRFISGYNAVKVRVSERILLCKKGW
jgi:hypothetical protein